MTSIRSFRCLSLSSFTPLVEIRNAIWTALNFGKNTVFFPFVSKFRPYNCVIIFRPDSYDILKVLSKEWCQCTILLFKQTIKLHSLLSGYEDFLNCLLLRCRKFSYLFFAIKVKSSEYVCLRYIEFRRLFDDVRYACFCFPLNWFVVHWHPSIAAYP